MWVCAREGVRVACALLAARRGCVRVVAVAAGRRWRWPLRRSRWCAGRRVRDGVCARRREGSSDPPLCGGCAGGREVRVRRPRYPGCRARSRSPAVRLSYLTEPGTAQTPVPAVVLAPRAAEQRRPADPGCSCEKAVCGGLFARSRGSSAGAIIGARGRRARPPTPASPAARSRQGASAAADASKAPHRPTRLDCPDRHCSMDLGMR